MTAGRPFDEHLLRGRIGVQAIAAGRLEPRDARAALVVFRLIDNGSHIEIAVLGEARMESQPVNRPLQIEHQFSLGRLAIKREREDLARAFGNE